MYYDDGGHPMLGSTFVRDPKFTRRVVAETRALLSTIYGGTAADGAGRACHEIHGDRGRPGRVVGHGICWRKEQRP
jgi:hypothetical protein